MKIPVQVSKLDTDSKRQNDRRLPDNDCARKQRGSKLRDGDLPAEFRKDLGTTVNLAPEVDGGESFPHYKRVSDYLLGTCIGEGSFAKVRLGLHCPTSEKVAVKVINKAKAKKDSYVYRNLHREGKLMQMMRHPNIVQVYDILETGNNYYLVTELCTGGDLIEIVTEKGFLPEDTVRKYIYQLVNAVAYLHERGIVHRDLKVENILLDNDDNIKIIDFGLSNTLPRAYGDTTCYLATQCGSPAYAAPELLGKKTYGAKVDVWSIGVITFALLAGKLPFTVEPFHIHKLCKKMLRGEMNPIPANVSNICRFFIKKLLQPDCGQRPSTAEVLKHKWISTYRPEIKAQLKNSVSSLIIDRISSDVVLSRRHSYFAPPPIDSAVVKKMCGEFGFSAVDVMQCVHKNRPGPALATYYLLMKKRATEKATSKRSSELGSTVRARVDVQPNAKDLNQGYQSSVPPRPNEKAAAVTAADPDKAQSKESGAVRERESPDRSKQISSPTYDAIDAKENASVPSNTDERPLLVEAAKDSASRDIKTRVPLLREPAMTKENSTSWQTSRNDALTIVDEPHGSQSVSLRRSRSSSRKAEEKPKKIIEVKEIMASMRKAREVLQKRNRPQQSQGQSKASETESEVRNPPLQTMYKNSLWQTTSPVAMASFRSRQQPSPRPSTTETNRTHLEPPSPQVRPASQNSAAAKRPSKVFALRRNICTPTSPNMSHYTPDWLKSNGEDVTENHTEDRLKLPPLVSKTSAGTVSSPYRQVSDAASKINGRGLSTENPASNLSSAQQVIVTGQRRGLDADSPVKQRLEPEPVRRKTIVNKPKFGSYASQPGEKSPATTQRPKRNTSESITTPISYLAATKPRTFPRDRNSFPASS